MSSEKFQRVLTATGYIAEAGVHSRGLTTATDAASPRLRPAMSDQRIGLMADAVFSAHNTPTAVFKDCGNAEPSLDQITMWHEAAWNISLAPLLWIVTPTDVRLYDCYASPRGEHSPQGSAPLDTFSIDAETALRSLDTMCGRLATETGSFWSSTIGSKIDRRHRVDRELLAEIKTLEEELTLLPPARRRASQDPEAEVRHSRDLAQRLIGRCIFTWYLLDRGIADQFIPVGMPHSLPAMLESVESAFKLFQWLRETFNGDLFPMDDPVAEQDRLSERHLELLRHFAESRSLIYGKRGQGRLFGFRFDAIPVDLISAIYQQFARSSAAESARVQGLHYTPVELVHLVLDPVFEGLPANARVLDPTCGSGAFLVEAFRRLVWKRIGGGVARRKDVREVLYNQVFGVDINPSALGIAAFSLYLAALELDQDPVTDPADLKFDRLINQTLFSGDSIGECLPAAIARQPFDAVFGNPPWTSVKRSDPKRSRGSKDSARPRRSPDQVFLARAAECAGDGGRVGMVMKATPFFSRDPYAIEARSALFAKLAPVALVNLSALRREQLFPDAVAPALLFFGRCAKVSKEKMLVGSVPWNPQFRRSGIFQIGPSDLHQVSVSRVMKTPAVLKAATFGTARDEWLIEKLEETFPTLDQLLGELDGVRARGQGFQIEGDANPVPAEYRRMDVLTPKMYTPFRIDHATLPRFERKTLHRPRDISIFRGPLLICPKASFSVATQRGRYSAATSLQDLLYTENFYGVSFGRGERASARTLSAILNSSLTAFQLAFGGGSLGLERSTVEPKDLLSLRVPDLRRVAPRHLAATNDAERMASRSRDDAEAVIALDDAVFNLYQLEREERVLVRESLLRAQALIFEGRAERQQALNAPRPKQLSEYAEQILRTVNAYMAARGVRHLEATTYAGGHDGLERPRSGLAAVRFRVVAGPVTRDQKSVHSATVDEMDRMLFELRSHFDRAVLPYLNERREIRVYGEGDVLLIKPAESRYWTRTAGLNDADAILADHWLHASHATQP